MNEMPNPRKDHPLNLAPASVSDYRELARKRLPRQLFDYVDGGSFGEYTLSANRDDLRDIQLRQRVLRDVSQMSLSTTVMGQDLAMPVLLAPIGFGGMMARRGEVQAARAAERAGVVFCESTLSICAIEEVAQAVERPFWFQLYVMKDRSYAEDLISRVKATGCTTLILTVDLPVIGRRYRDGRNGLGGGISAMGQVKRRLDFARHPSWVRDVALGGRPLTFGNLERALPDAKVPQDFQRWVDGQFDPSVTWDDLEWLRSHWDGKIALKGILDAEDAREAVARGVDAIIVSNHGGRQLDDVPSTIHALPAIVEAVDGRIEVLMDGGIRSGLDVVKALSLGARACLIGRPWVYAVAARGEKGVEHILRIIHEEIRVTLGLTGFTNVQELNRSALVDP
jgi:L-lactate dehydrogenase (cytochrome)